MKWMLTLVITLALLTATSVFGAIFLPISDQELVDLTPEIVIGMILGTVDNLNQPCMLHDFPCTSYKVAVIRGLKGSLQTDEVIEVRIPGGTVQAGSQTYYYPFSASPNLQKGREIILFLRPDDLGSYQIVRLKQGAFVEINDNSTSRRFAVRDSEDHHLDLGISQDVRNFDRYAEAIATGQPLDPSSYMTETSIDLRLPLDKGGPICPELPTVVRHDWYLNGDVDGYTFEEMRAPIEDALTAWNNEIHSLDMPFSGVTTADPFEFDDGQSVVAVDQTDLTEGVLAVGTARFRCQFEEGIRHISEGIVLLNPNTGPNMSDGPFPRLNMADLMAHEFGHTLSLGHSCGGFTGIPCDNPYVDDAIMRASLHGDGRGAALAQWDKDMINAVFASNPEPCRETTSNLCLANKRFSVTVDWATAGGTGAATALPISGVDDSGLFWFFSSNNLEMLVKVLDACGINGRFWVFAAATTDVEYNLRVTDTFTGTIKQYFNPLGNAAAATTDTDAFATCP